MLNILLVEDNANNVSFVEDMFAFDDIPAKLAVAGSGEEAMSLAATLLPALILMDLRLPGIDGLEVMQVLKRNLQTKDIPVWAITAYAMAGDEERAREAGCGEYFVKPLSSRELGDRIKEFLQKRQRTESHEHVSA